MITEHSLGLSEVERKREGQTERGRKEGGRDRRKEKEERERDGKKLWTKILSKEIHVTNGERDQLN